MRRALVVAAGLGGLLLGGAVVGAVAVVLAHVAIRLRLFARRVA
jgi:hypothetical protein